MRQASKLIFSHCIRVVHERAKHQAVARETDHETEDTAEHGRAIRHYGGARNLNRPIKLSIVEVSIDEKRNAMEAHVVTEKARLSDIIHIKNRLKSLLSEKFNVDHSTIEFEYIYSECEE